MLDMPFLSKETYRRVELTILQAASKAAQKSMDNAAEQIRKTKRDVVNSGVSVDSTWQKRSYSSLNALVSCISIGTDEVLDIEAMTQFCRICKSLLRNPKTTEKPHTCRNHKGSAARMETVGAYRIFERSKFVRNLCYTEYYGDGDSNANDALNDIYGENSLKKIRMY
ncbi:hypothetical protein AVEN_192277-1 [Araneus ventricosus]|uniref:Mutator-like transposase domain-containing protein n=1 Tax=Araneus ventricosus TaxID=182803 RepID=A0A4Y2NQD9_ARAVE|nr:hypothetical protein AVEN_192277-1 [Araneus ventricosus]